MTGDDPAVVQMDPCDVSGLLAEQDAAGLEEMGGRVLGGLVHLLGHSRKACLVLVPHALLMAGVADDMRHGRKGQVPQGNEEQEIQEGSGDLFLSQGHLHDRHELGGHKEQLGGGGGQGTGEHRDGIPNPPVPQHQKGE